MTHTKNKERKAYPSPRVSGGQLLPPEQPAKATVRRRKMTRIIVTDRCTEPGCQCNDTRGIVLYDGPSREDAAEACQNARYPNPTIETTEEGKMTIQIEHWRETDTWPVERKA